ncbi:MAG: hypothetical protein AABX03_02220 [Nanoarchaeota archaeon]
MVGLQTSIGIMFQETLLEATIRRLGDVKDLVDIFYIDKDDNKRVGIEIKRAMYRIYNSLSSKVGIERLSPEYMQSRKTYQNEYDEIIIELIRHNIPTDDVPPKAI